MKLFYTLLILTTTLKIIIHILSMIGLIYVIELLWQVPFNWYNVLIAIIIANIIDYMTVKLSTNYLKKE